MKLITLAALVALTLPAPAVFTLSIDGPLVPSYWHGDHWDHWDHNGIHVDPPQSVPEASPALVVSLAGAALIMRRNGGAK